MKNSFIGVLLVAILSLTANFSWADGRIGKYNWPEYKKVTVPDSMQFEPAFFVNNVTTIQFAEFGSTSLIAFERIYINSEEAAEDYSKRELYIPSYGSLKMLVARTVKSSGEAKELDGEQILQTYIEEKNKYGKRKYRRVQLIYPDLQVGDVVDIAYEIEIDSYIYSDLMYLESELPSLYSRITLRNTSRLEMTAYNLNGMPDVKHRTEGGIETLSWEQTGVKKKQDHYFNALRPDAPSFVYVLWIPGENMSYRPIYNNDVFQYPVDFWGRGMLTKYFEEKGVIDASLDKLVNLKKLIFHFEEEYTWNKEDKTPDVSETAKSLKSGIVDEVLFFRYLMKYMKENNIRYERGFTKSLLNGRFENGFVSLEQMSDRYLLIVDDNGGIHFLFPPTGEDEFYYLDEIPFYNEGNKSIALYGAKDFLDEESLVDLPPSNERLNAHFAQVMVKTTGGSDSLVYTIKRKDMLKGQLSHLTRTAKGEVWQDELNIITDSVMVEPKRVEKAYPYTVEFEQDSINVDILSKVENNMYAVELKSLLPEGVYQSDELMGEWGDYLALPFLKSHVVAVFLQGEESVALMEDNNEIKYANDIGEVSVTVTSVVENVLKLNFTLNIVKRFVDGEEQVEQFEQLLQQYADLLEKKWMIEIK